MLPGLFLDAQPLGLFTKLCLENEEEKEKVELWWQLLPMCQQQHIYLDYYSLFTYFGSSNFFWFLLHKVCEETVCAVNVLYIYFLKMCLVWKYGEYNKSYERRSKKCPSAVLSIFTFGIVGWRVGKIAADFYPQPLKNRLLQPVYLLRIVTQLVEMLAYVLPCSGVTHKWHLSRSFYAGPWKWRENNGAKMTSWSCKKFPVRVSKTKLVKITLPCRKSLTAADLSPKDDFDQLFNFQGPVISEWTIVLFGIMKLLCDITEWPHLMIMNQV